MITDDLVFEYETRRHYFIGVASRIVGTTNAEDMVQEGFGRAIQKIDQFNGDSTLKTWLTTIIRNVSLESRRGLKGRSVHVSVKELDYRIGAQSIPSAESTDLHRCVVRLPKNYRPVIISELSESLPSPMSSTLKARRFRAVAELRRMMT